MENGCQVQISQDDLPREADLDGGRFSVAVAGMLLCGIGLLWWSSTQYYLISPADPVLAAVLCGVVAIAGIAAIALAIWGAVRGFLLKIPAFRMIDGQISGFHFSTLPLEAVEAFHIVKRRAAGLNVDELHISVGSTGKTLAVPIWVLEKSARLRIFKAVGVERSAN